MRAPHPTTPIHRPLADPVWWVALLLWILNDQVWKGSSSMPAALTGKLSDVCGLWVLPAALRCLLVHAGVDQRSPQHQALRMAPYAVIGVYFAGLQLWPALVLASHSVLAGIGIPSRITADPTDLWALLVLVPAYRRYRHLIPRNPSRSRPRLAWAIPAYSLVLLTTVATSRVDEPNGVQRTAGLFLYNNTNQEQQVTIQQVRANVDANCFFIQNQPNAHLTTSLFEAVETVRIQPKGLLALDARAQTNLQSDLNDNPCQAMILSGPNRDPQLLFWRFEQFPIQHFKEVPANLKINGVIALEPVSPAQPERLRYRHLGPTRIVYPTTDKAPDPASQACAPPAKRAVLDWGQPFPKGQHKLVSLSPGPDGCIALELARPGDDQLKTRRYLCVPPKRFPFSVGSTLQFRSLEGEAATIGGNIEGWRISTPESEPPLEFWVILGQGLPRLGRLTFGTQAQNNCAYAPQDGECMTLSRPLDVVARSQDTGAEVILRAQDASAPQKLAQDNGEWTLELLQGEERSVFDGACSGDRVRTGRELQLLATWRRKAQ